MDPSLATAASIVQLAIGLITLLYVVFGLGARFAVIEFQVGQLWRWYARGRSGREEDENADGKRG